MIIKKTLIGASICASIAGCSHNLHLLDEVVTLNQPYRVIEHNFETKYRAVILPPGDPEVPETTKPISSGNPAPEIFNTVTEMPAQTTDLKQPDEPLSYVDVEFFNESAVMKDHDEVIRRIKETLNADEFLIIGHSHGKSSIGVENLATQRAQYVANVLSVSGISRKNIHFLSSWSDGGLGHTVPKGARIIALRNGLNSTLALITGLPQTEDRS